MCTVTYINHNDQRIFTSNRDENKQRPAALWPFSNAFQQKRLFYPKDPVGNGSWIIATDDGAIGVLLNGAIVKHTRHPFYKKSRGLVLVELMQASCGIDYFNEESLQDIEPFTIIHYKNECLHKLQWDGENKFRGQLNPSENYIWSSVTLYEPEVIHGREKRFASFLKKLNCPDAQAIREFHLQNYGDYENGFVINRKNGVLTQSLTQAIVFSNEISLSYNDLLNNTFHEEIIETDKAAHLQKL